MTQVQRYLQTKMNLKMTIKQRYEFDVAVDVDEKFLNIEVEIDLELINVDTYADNENGLVK